MVIPYDTIEEKYLVTGDLSCLSTLFLLSIEKNTKKSVNKDFLIYKPVRITANTKREFNTAYV